MQKNCDLSAFAVNSHRGPMPKKSGFAEIYGTLRIPSPSGSSMLLHADGMEIGGYCQKDFNHYTDDKDNRLAYFNLDLGHFTCPASCINAPLRYPAHRIEPHPGRQTR